MISPPFIYILLLFSCAPKEPLLIDVDYYARVEGREIISNLAKAAGLATMIATMRPDLDNPDAVAVGVSSAIKQSIQNKKGEKLQRLLK